MYFIYSVPTQKLHTITKGNPIAAELQKTIQDRALKKQNSNLYKKYYSNPDFVPSEAHNNENYLHDLKYFIVSGDEIKDYELRLYFGYKCGFETPQSIQKYIETLEAALENENPTVKFDEYGFEIFPVIDNEANEMLATNLAYGIIGTNEIGKVKEELFKAHGVHFSLKPSVWHELIKQWYCTHLADRQNKFFRKDAGGTIHFCDNFVHFYADCVEITRENALEIVQQLKGIYKNF